MRSLLALLAALTAGAAEAQQYDYTYDPSGNITKSGEDRYVYDALGRLKSATAITPVHPTNAQQFEYDRYGNLTKITTSGGITNEEELAVHGPSNRLSGQCLTANCVRATYDPAGNQTGKNAGDNWYRWDATGMMTELEVPRPLNLPPRHEQYVYDANGERVVTVSLSDQTRLYTPRSLDQKVAREFVYSEATSGWKWSKDYVYRGGTLFAAWVPGEATATPHRHYHVDHLGTPRLITDSQGYKLSKHTYWPFGGEAPGSDVAKDERLRFTGHERDFDNADPSQTLDYMHARYYRAASGRFLSVDPARSADPTTPQTWNRYAYSRDNPLRYVDPDGRRERDVIRVRVNVIFSNADRQISSSGTMRQIVERGITEARSVYNNAGIALDIRRYEGDLTPNRFHRGARGAVQTAAGSVAVGDFLASQNGAINLVFMGDLNKGSSTDGPGTPALFGVQIDEDNVAHEMAHQLGNVLPAAGIIANTGADIIYSAEILQLQMGIGFSSTFEWWLRDEAAKLDPCPQGDESCD